MKRISFSYKPSVNTIITLFLLFLIPVAVWFVDIFIKDIDLSFSSIGLIHKEQNSLLHRPVAFHPGYMLFFLTI